MKKILFLSFFLTPLLSFAQDLIVTQKGDSLNVHITKMTDYFVSYTQSDANDIGHKSMDWKDIRSVKKNFFWAPERERIPLRNLKFKTVEYKRFRLGVYGGYSYLVGVVDPRLPAEIQDYYDALKHGYHFKLEASYFFNRFLGIGLRTYGFYNRNEINNVSYVFPDGHIETGILRDDISTYFFGPCFSSRILLRNKKVSLFGDLAIGYVQYYNAATVLRPLNYQGNTIGTDLDFGIDYMTQENLAVNLSVSLFSGILTSAEVENGGKAQVVQVEESLIRGNVSVGFKWFFK